MALTPVEQVNLFIGNIPSNPFYPVLTDEEIEAILDLCSGDITCATKRAATSAAFIIISFPSREKVGDLEIWNSYATNYLDLLNSSIVNNPSYSIPKGLMPYAAGIDEADYIQVLKNPARHIGELERAVRNTKQRSWPYNDDL